MIDTSGVERELTYEEVHSALSARKEVWLTYKEFKALQHVFFRAKDGRGLPIPCDDFVGVTYGRSVLEPDFLTIRPLMVRVLPEGMQ